MADTTLTVEVVGKLSVRVGERDAAPIGRKSRALIGCLALSETGEETRERLVGLLWSETAEERARASLRQALYEIRGTLGAAGFDGLDADKLTVKLDRSRIDVDLWRVLDDAAAGHAHELLLNSDGATDRLLEEFDSIDPAFRVWLLAKRQSLGSRVTRLLESAMVRRDSDTTRISRALMSLDPTHEEAARTLIRAAVQAGDIGGAFRIYKTLWDLLEKEYDVEPSKQTLDLIAELRLSQVPGAEPLPPAAPVQSLPATPLSLMGGGAVPAPLVPAPLPAREVAHRPSGTKLIVTVAAFDMSPVAADQHYLVSGFRRELIACLVRFREWFICDGAVSPGHDLGWGGTSQYAIEAVAFADAPSLRLTLTLREIATNLYLWSERLRISMSEWLDSQQLILRRLTTALNVHLSASRLATLAPSSNVNVDLLTYDLWLRGQALFFDWRPTSWHSASEIFQEVITKSPSFAPAYSSLAQLQNTIHFVHPGIFRTTDRTDQALAYARESTRLDPIDSRAQLCLGWALATANQHDRAVLHHELACELNENDPWTMVSAALGYAFRGQHDQARRLANHALNLSLTPSPAHWRYQSMVRYVCGDAEGSVAAAERAGSTVANVLVWKTAALSQLGRREAAAAALEEFFSTVEARWFGSVPPTRETMSRWIMHSFPIERPEIWERLREGFGRAGAPVARLEHNTW